MFWIEYYCYLYVLLEPSTGQWPTNGSTLSPGLGVPHMYGYLQISVWPHNGVWAAVVKKRRLTTRDHGQKLPVDRLLLLPNRLHKHRQPRGQQRNETDLQQITWCLTVLMSDLLCCAVGPGPVYAARWGAMCWALYHFDGKGLLIHAGAGAACYASTQTADINNSMVIKHKTIVHSA